MPKKYNLAVFIGRFQPFHNGHQHAIESALAIADRVLVLIGSSWSAESIKNPWQYHEREAMITSVFTDGRVKCAPLQDFSYDDSLWITEVQILVQDFISDHSAGGLLPQNPTVCLVGHKKDESSYYLNIFPQWKFEEVGFMDKVENVDIDATKIREFIFELKTPYIYGVMNNIVLLQIEKWKKTDVFKELVAEYKAIKEYKQSWASAPFPPTFVTVDAVVIQSGHVLVIERDKSPGKGLWALPGGFVEPHERLLDACLRELSEETTIKLQRDTLLRCLRHKEVFDSPYRDLRGRTFSHAFLFRLNDQSPLPKTKAGDDARSTYWMPMAEFEQSKQDFYADHHDIITHMSRK